MQTEARWIEPLSENRHPESIRFKALTVPMLAAPYPIKKV